MTPSSLTVYIDAPIYATTVYRNRRVDTHIFFPLDQFCGFSGSRLEYHVTSITSFSEASEAEDGHAEASTFSFAFRDGSDRTEEDDCWVLDWYSAGRVKLSCSSGYLSSFFPLAALITAPMAVSRMNFILLFGGWGCLRVWVHRSLGSNRYCCILRRLISLPTLD